MTEMRWPTAGTGDDGQPWVLSREAAEDLAARMVGRRTKAGTITRAEVTDDAIIVELTPLPGLGLADLMDGRPPMSFGIPGDGP